MNFQNINVISRYEVKLLRRSWLFRIFAILALAGISVVILGYQTPLNQFSSIWPKIAVSSLMPFCSIYFYNIAQSVIVIFLAGSFLKRDKKLDTAEVIYVRPMSNADYIAGKTLGIVKVFLGLNVIFLIITAFFNVIINRSPFSPFPYIFYLLTISLPSLLFVLGLSFTVMCLLKNQAVTFIVMLGITGTVFFYSDTLYGVFDFFGVNIPAIFSDVTGHADLKTFLLQRSIFILLGIGFTVFTIALVKRLPHKPWKTPVVYTLGTIFLLGGFTAGMLYVMNYHHLLRQRDAYIATYNKYAEENNVSILTHELNITPHGKKMTGESILTAVNKQDRALDKIILYLNPALQISSIKSAGTPLPFIRENQAVLITKPLAAGEEIAITLNYAGTIDEAVCYTDIPEKDLFNNPVNEDFYKLGTRYAWLEPRFTLLTPECLWYPVAAAPAHPAAPYKIKKNFTNYTLTVNQSDGQTVLSQGTGTAGDNKITFTNTQPLPGISLTIADYDKKSIRVDSTDYEILYFKGHDYFSKFFTTLSDTLPYIIRDYKNDLEIAKGRNYPFSKFVLAETPVQFATHIRNWKSYTEYVMPEILFIPERGATLSSDFRAEKKRMQHWRREGQGTPDEMELAIESFRNFFDNVLSMETTWQGDINKFNIAALFFGHTNFIESKDYPIMDIAINTMQNLSASANNFRPWRSVINDQQRANLYLENHSFEQAISDNELKPEIFYELLKLKSTALKNYIHTRIPPEEFSEFLKVFFEKNKFTDIPFHQLKDSFEDYFGINLNDFICQWYTENHSPTLFIKDVDANQVIVDEVTRYQIKFKVNNPSDVNAIVTATVMQGGGFPGGGRRRGRNMQNDNIAENYIVPARQAREIKIIVDERPANISINTNISHNLPTTHNFNFSKIENTTDDTLAGSYPVDPEIFKPNPNEIIIDNEDSGFRTIASNTRHKLKDLFQKSDEEKYKNFFPWRLPSTWTAIVSDAYYGAIVSSAHYKKKGSGNNSVEWQASLPHDGYYEISVWNPKGNRHFMRRGPQRKEERNQTYLLRADQVNETVTLDLEMEEEGWVPLGHFYLPRGKATITLTDKVSGNYVIADAVKFTLIE